MIYETDACVREAIVNAISKVAEILTCAILQLLHVAYATGKEVCWQRLLRKSWQATGDSYSRAILTLRAARERESTTHSLEGGRCESGRMALQVALLIDFSVASMA